MKRIIAAVVRKECPAEKILELHSQYGGKAVDDADAWLKPPADLPRDLAQRVTQLAEQKKRGEATYKNPLGHFRPWQQIDNPTRR
jgi:hypothetical protein